ncbi:hypothetical protein [Novosphingobium clariflavum]|uniref:Uncharacterized protein n=1 Tax=Novosphingobium clariflavum TaxID=2029884 RepID=A0ABV6S1E5_9SPHN|nr:hypothetical protein [Novosphingobium clariflavum]
MNIKHLTRYAAVYFAGILSAGAVSAAPIFGPQGEFSALFYKLEWKPGSSCRKPLRPYTSDSYAMDSYRDDGMRYLKCVKEAAGSDIDYASQVVADGYEKAVNDFLKEVKQGY